MTFCVGCNESLGHIATKGFLAQPVNRSEARYIDCILRSRCEWGYINTDKEAGETRRQF
jgi:hypothetical protein